MKGANRPPSFYWRIAMNVIGYKLVTGEVVLGDVIEETDKSILVSNLAQLVVHDAGDGRVGIGMQPFIPFAKGNITLSNSQLLAGFAIEDQIEREYNRLFGSGLILPETKLVDPYAIL